MTSYKDYDHPTYYRWRMFRSMKQFLSCTSVLRRLWISVPSHCTLMNFVYEDKQFWSYHPVRIGDLSRLWLFVFLSLKDCCSVSLTDLLTMNISDKGCPRNASCALNYISAFALMPKMNELVKLISIFKTLKRFKYWRNVRNSCVFIWKKNNFHFKSYLYWIKKK